MPPALIVLTPDPRVPGAPQILFRWFVRDLDFKPPFVPHLPTLDGSWHRPFTTLELAALQGLPVNVRGAPLKLAGDSITGWRRRIGNAVPSPTAHAVAVKMLVTMLGAELSVFALSSDKVWVLPRLGWAGDPDGADGDGSVWRDAVAVGDGAPLQ